MCYLLTNIPLKTSSQTDRPFTHCQKVTFSFFQRVSQTRCRARCCKGQSVATFPLTNRALLLPSPTFLARPAISAAGSCFQPLLGSHKGTQGSWLPAYGVRCVHTRSPTTIPWHRLTQGSALLLCEPFLRAFGGGGHFVSLKTTFVGLYSQGLCGAWKFCFTPQWVYFQARKFISQLSEQLNPFWLALLCFGSGFRCSVTSLACLTTSAIHRSSPKRIKTSGLSKKLPTPDPQPAPHTAHYPLGGVLSNRQTGLP